MASLPAGCRLEVIGDGPERAALEELARGTGRRIVFAGDVDDHARDVRLMSADVFCQPSLHEGFGIAIVEAMACGRCVVATDSGGPRDFVTDGVDGFLVKPGDVASLADALRDLATDSSRVERMGAAARSTSMGLTAAAMTDSYVRIYESARRHERIQP
jgi:phosphatidylinositol alpha 1,6-mannosyltransferase